MGGARGRLISYSDRQNAVKLIEEARKNGARLQPACEELDITSRTYQRWTEGGDIKRDQRPLVNRPEPKNKLSQQERQEVLDVVNSPDFEDLPPSQIVPSLADQGKYIASESTMYRILKEEKQNTHRRQSKKPRKRQKPSHLATKPNQVWTWDITWLNGPIKGKYYKLYLVIDMFSRMIISYETWKTENSENAQKLIKKGILNQDIVGKPVVLHSDNGSPMKAASFLKTLEKLGVQSSFSRPRVSNDNPYSEALFRTLKYKPEYPKKGFKNLKKARKWVEEFVNWYNNIHLHSGINFITPYQRHYGFGKKIMIRRSKTYIKAKQKHPERWSKQTRDWSLPNYVTLTPMSEDEIQICLESRNKK